MLLLLLLLALQLLALQPRRWWPRPWAQSPRMPLPTLLRARAFVCHRVAVARAATGCQSHGPHRRLPVAEHASLARSRRAVTFDIDANGIVNVSASDKASGKQQQIRIQSSGGLSDQDIDRMVKEAEQFASADADRKAKVEVQNEADSTVYQTEKTLNEYKDKLPQEDADQIKADIEAVKAAKEDENVGAEELKEKVEALKKSSMKIGEAMYKGQGGGGDGGDGGSTAEAETEEPKKDEEKK